MVVDARRTERLLIRPPRASDAADLHARRNDDDVARYQDWLTPFPLDRAEALVAESTALDLLVEQCREWGDRTLTVSWAPGKGSPEAMYLRYGFEPTGAVLDGELEGRLAVT